MRILVVGATGILAPAAATLAAEGHRVTGIARDVSAIPTGVAPLAVDATDAYALATALGSDSWDAAIAYCPAVSSQSVSIVGSAVTGTLVKVLTSEAAAPGRRDPLLQPHVLLLGWTTGPSGARWHTPAEVSAAALAVLESGRSLRLGTVTPWQERP